MEISFKGKRALVTGASRGIGRGIAVTLAKAGAEVVALARSKDALEALCAEQPGITALVCDLSDWARTREAVQTVLPIHLLVNNAGMGYQEPFLDITEESLDTVYAVNFKAAVNVSQVVTADLISRGEKGAVVHMSSTAGAVAVHGLVNYGSTKFALESLARSMAQELGPKGIRTNTIQPQLVRTELTEATFGKDLKGGQMIVDRVPLGRASTIDEVVGPTVFLLSDHASMINGASVDVTGGILTTGP